MIDIDDLNSLADGEDLDKEIVRLERLLVDLRHIRVHGAPDEISLHAAPSLARWSMSYRPALCLVGCSTGHPILPGIDRYITTSDLCVISELGSWARTRSRYYRLGRKTDMNPKILLS